ncbi:FAD-binding protein [Dyella acidiphila]|uniref:FAD-binding protein n=1 Tax=Dyella acidiphila TaxID=2775866 RepID=A0ABR9G5K6_9GAMM|nr:FAD-binding protein [Dyella acidiphila]MBE1159319.1 FAD-binding protein [Dyella acidiphila]
MSYISIEKNDSRYETLKKGFNQRWPVDGAEAQAIYVCRTVEDAQQALQQAVSSGLRPTIRSGGHCYEGFVSNNPDGVIIDVGFLTELSVDDTVYRIGAGNQNWDGYVNMFKLTGSAPPGGSCYSVGSGGHIVGGGYGLLSRLHGLTVDWLKAVELLTVSGGQVQRQLVSASNEPELFKLCRGGGGGNAGIITSYHFEPLPEAPAQVALLVKQYPWSQFAKDKPRFKKFLMAYSNFMKQADLDPETYGLFTLFKLTHISAGNIGLVVQYTDSNGKLDNIQPLVDLIKAMDSVAKSVPVSTYIPGTGPNPFTQQRHPLRVAGGDLPVGTVVYDWLYATQTVNGSGNNQRGKYKSSYMKEAFAEAEMEALFKYLVETYPDDSDFSQSLVQVDSYGGAINHIAKGNNGFDPSKNGTAVFQRNSVMKLQYQTYWTDRAQDDKHVQWLRDFYYEVHQEHGYNGTPCPESVANPNSRYEGCYIGYPDIDMLTGKVPGAANYNWGELYYGKLYEQLVAIKNKYDPDGIFKFSMALGATP